MWVADAEAGAPSFPRLQANMAADVCIVGGGIAGLTAAYQLVKAGKASSGLHSSCPRDSCMHPRCAACSRS